MSIVDLKDSLTNEDLIDKCFELKNGMLEYYKDNNGVPQKKLAFIKYYETLDWIILYSLDKSLINTKVSNIKMIIIVVAIISVLLANLILLFITRMVVGNVKSITNNLYEISEGDGDLTSEITISSNDETGLLAKYFNNFHTKIKKYC